MAGRGMLDSNDNQPWSVGRPGPWWNGYGLCLVDWKQDVDDSK